MSTLSEEERAAKAAQNAKEAEQTYKMAKEQAERDRLNGQRPVLAEVADSIKNRLIREDFTTKPGYEGASGEGNAETNN